MKFLPVFVGLAILSLIVLIVEIFYAQSSAPTIESIPGTTLVEFADGRCIPGIAIETLQHPDQRVSDLYRECMEQTNQATCLRIDRFHYDQGIWRADGKPECQWQEDRTVQPNSLVIVKAIYSKTCC